MNLRSKVWLCVGIAAIMMVTGLFVVACGGGDSNGPEQTVQQVLTAMENQDMDALWEVMDPQMFEEYTSMGMTEEALKAMMAEEMFADAATMKFSDVEFESAVSDDGQTATVTIVSGTVTITENGESTVEDVKDSDEPVVFSLVLRDGKWYWDITSLM